MEAIIKEILAGNTERFRLIIREYSDELLRIAYHFVHDWDEAQDIAQMTYVACFRSLKKYDPARPFRSWILRIHLNNCKAAYRSRMRRLKREVVLSEIETLPGESTSADDEETILRQLDTLPPKQKAAFVLIEIENYSSKEAAELLGCSDSTVRVHLARAKQTLRQRLTQLGIEYE